MSTAIVGSVFVDIKGFAFKDYAPTGTNIGTVSFVPGGVCRNVCEDFANQGVPSMFVTMTDESGMGFEVRKSLEDKGVNMEHSLVVSGGMGIWLAVLDQHGDLVGSISQQPNFTALEAYIRDHGERILADADNVVLEIDMNAPIAKSVLEICAKLKKDVYAIVANMGVILAHPETLSMLRCYICNEIETSRLFGVDVTGEDADSMIRAIQTHAPRFGIRQMIVTMGARGSVYCDLETGETGFCPAIPTTMVDSTGAGDAFFAGTVMACTRGYALKDAIRVGTRLASATIGSPSSSCSRVEGLFEL